MPTDPTDFLSESKKMITSLNSEKGKYEECLKASCHILDSNKESTIDPSNPSQHFGPEDIAREYAVDLEDLLQYKIVLNSLEVFNFLPKITTPQQLERLTPWRQFRRKVNGSRYRDKFNRPVSKNGNTNVFTYSEMLILVGINKTLKI